MATHYETLQVVPSASYEKIRRAYYDAARQWHPDHFVDGSPEEAATAETAMRLANEAWHVLGDEQKRRDYDRGLRGGASGAGRNYDGAATITVDDGVTRIDPRLIDPGVLDARRRQQLDDADQVSFRVRSILPFVGFVGMMIGIFIFTAYARGDSEPLPSEQTVPGPSVGVRANACVRLLQGGTLIEVPCDGITDGRLVRVLEVDSPFDCPIETVREVPLFGDHTGCLVQP